MFSNEVVLYAFMTKYLKRLLSDVSTEKLRLQPAPGMNTPLWILGHLTICHDYILSQLGKEGVCSKRWFPMFGPGSEPNRVPESGPTREELWTTFENGYASVMGAIISVKVEEMEKSQPIDFLRPSIQTVGQLVSHLLTTHIAGHVGQLSAWRRAAGLSSVGLPND